MKDLKKIISIRRKITRAMFDAVLEEYGQVFVKVVVRSDDLSVATLSQWPDEKLITKNDFLFCTDIELDSAPMPVMADTLILSVKNESVSGFYEKDDSFGFLCRFNGIVSKVDIPWLSVYSINTKDPSDGVVFVNPLVKTLGVEDLEPPESQPAASVQTGNVVQFRPRAPK